VKGKERRKHLRVNMPCPFCLKLPELIIGQLYAPITHGALAHRKPRRFNGSGKVCVALALVLEQH
jgi:hypothetical protein